MALQSQSLGKVMDDRRKPSSQGHLLAVLLALLLRRPGQRRRQRVVRVGVEVRGQRRDQPLAVAQARLQLQVLRRHAGQLQQESGSNQLHVIIQWLQTHTVSG